MSVVDDVGKIAGLIKKIGDVELYKQILTLETEVMELTREKRLADEKVEELERALKFKENLSFDAPFCWLKGDSTPYCAGCWEEKHKAVHVVLYNENSHGAFFNCPVCKHQYDVRPPAWFNLSSTHRQ